MKRIPRLDGLRAFAFIAVFLNHSIHLPMAWVGVDLFFVLSGFLITTILLRDQALPIHSFLGKFYARRARRILPPYFLVLGLVALLGLPEIDWGKIWWHFLFFVQNFSVALGYGTGSLTPYWSLAVEEQFYIVWPLFVFFLPRRVLSSTCLLMLFAAPLLRAYFTTRVDSYTVIFCLTPFRMDLLAAGALIGIVRIQRPDLLNRSQRWAWGLMILAGTSFLVPAAISSSWRASAHSLGFNILGYSLSTLVFSALLLLVLTTDMVLFDRILEWRPLVFLGQISYMCYLLHEPVLQYMWQFTSKLQGTLIAFVITILLSTLSWRWIERPILSARTSPSS